MGRISGKGLDSRQFESVKRSKENLFAYIAEHEPVLYSQLVMESGVKDPSVVRRRLTDLINDNRVSSTKLNHVVDNNKGRTRYHVIPTSKKITNLIIREEYLSKIGHDYYDGIKKGVPIDFQFAHKLKLLFKEFQDLEERFRQKSKGLDFESIRGFKRHNMQLLYDFQLILEAVVQVKMSQDAYWLWDGIENQILMTIAAMDKTYATYKDLRTNKIVGGPIKTMIANLLIENTKSGTMKKLGLSPKLGSKLEKELLNEDGSPKVNLINKINENSIWKKEFLPFVPSGETLLKKWKDLQS